MQTRLIKYVAEQMPRINMQLVVGFSESRVKEIKRFLEEAIEAAVHTMDTCGIKNFVYLGCRTSTPKENLDRLLRKRPYQRIYQVHETYSIEIVFSFKYEGVPYEMPFEIPYSINGRIRLKGVDNYPMQVVADKGGISRMKDSLYMETLRVTMIYIRDKFACMASIEGKLIYGSVIRTQQHYGKKGTRKDPPLLLYLFALKGFKETLDIFGVSDMIDIVKHVHHEEDVYHIAIGEDVYLRMRGYAPDNLVSRIAFSISDILGVYTDYEFDDLKTERYYRVALGAYTQAGMNDQDQLDEHASSHLVMCDNSLDIPSKRLHASIGIVYTDFAELVEHMFLNIDDLLLHLKRHRTNVYEKRICGTQLLMNGVIAKFHKDLYMVLNAKKDQSIISKINRLMLPRSFYSSLHATEMYDYVSTVYNDNTMPHLLRRKLVLHSSDLQSGKRGGFRRSSSGNKIPVEFQRFHSSYPLTMAMFTFPSQKPISTGSLVPFVEIDEDGNIKTPDYWKHFNNLYGENPSQ